jgi:predicted nucleic acid binding AN1-type Zn finger protein
MFKKMIIESIYYYQQQYRTIRLILRTTKKMPIKRCDYANCKRKIKATMPSDCSACGGMFCNHHRLLEEHVCKGMESRKISCRKILEKENPKIKQIKIDVI